MAGFAGVPSYLEVPRRRSVVVEVRSVGPLLLKKTPIILDVMGASVFGNRTDTLLLVPT